MPPVSSWTIGGVPPVLVVVVLCFLLLLLMSTVFCANSSESDLYANQQYKNLTSEMPNSREVNENESKIDSPEVIESDLLETSRSSSHKVVKRKNAATKTTIGTGTTTNVAANDRDRQRREKELLQDGVRYYQTVAKDGRIKSISMYDRPLQASQTTSKKKGKKEKSRSSKSKTRQAHQEKEKQLLKEGMRYYQLVVNDKRSIKSVSQYLEAPAKKATVTGSKSRRKLSESKGKNATRTRSPTQTPEKKDTTRRGKVKEDQLLQEGMRYYLEVVKNKYGVRSVSEYYQPPQNATTTTARRKESTSRKHSHNHRHNR